MSKALYERLLENALTPDQKLEASTDNSWLMTGSLHLSQGLDLWLLNQGDQLEVLEPLELREHIATTVKRMSELYTTK